MSNPYRKYDCIVVGGGAAGLCLGAHLSKKESKEHSCLILERRRKYADDRTWCFWKDPNESSWIEELISKQWWNWEVSGLGEAISHQASQRPYCYVRSSDFYRGAVSQIQQCSNVTLKTGVEVSATCEGDEGCSVQTDHGDYFAKYVIDARPQMTTASNSDGLLQIFVGREIIFESPTFDPHRAVLMGGLAADNRALWFQYLLPLDPYSALVEETAFAVDQIEIEELDNRLTSSIRKLAGGQKFKTLRVEKGMIPMQPINASTRGGSRIIRAGLAGGAARASTGYALRRIDRWAKQCADELAAGNPPCEAYSGKSIERSLDRIFLRAVRGNVARCPEFFLKMAKATTGDQFAAFLSGSSDPRVLYPVISRMPKRPFIVAATQDWIAKCLQRIPSAG